jgi:hypothetical protein
MLRFMGRRPFLNVSLEASVLNDSNRSLSGRRVETLCRPEPLSYSVEDIGNLRQGAFSLAPRAIIRSPH